jgi:hypothetical protein
MRSFWTIAALVIGLSSVGGYAYAVGTGAELGSPAPAFVPADVRAKPGGLRSFHFWHVGYGGYRGGK